MQRRSWTLTLSAVENRGQHGVIPANRDLGTLGGWSCFGSAGSRVACDVEEMKSGEIPALSRNGSSAAWLSSGANRESGQAARRKNHITLED